MIAVKRARNGSLEVVATEVIGANMAYHSIADFMTLAHPTYQTVQVGERKHILERFLQATNHSCDPNTIIDAAKMHLVSTRTINKNEAVTFFYPSTEWELSSPFKCGCLSAHCIGIVLGGRYLTKETASHHFITAHVLRLRTMESDAIRCAVGSMGERTGFKAGLRWGS